jgi:multidrug efflux pump subunit AcrB
MHLWRDRVGQVPGAEVLSFSADDGPNFGSDIAFDLAHPDWEMLKAASLEMEARLKEYSGLYDIQSSVSAVSDEFHIDIKPEAETLGITRFDLGSQVRHAFYGSEAQRIQRGTHELKVLVRYPQEDRRTTASLDSMFIRTPDGGRVPFNSVANLNVKPGFNEVTRIDYQRAVEVTAEAETDQVEPGRIKAELIETFIPQLQQKYPGLTWDTSGMSHEEDLAARSMTIGFVLALFGIYSLLAIPTRSYMQPLIIMGVIPFGIIGAVVGHLVTGYAISMMSLVGIIALSGVVVNDSLIMVDFVNRQVREGISRPEAAVQAGVQRFRAIILTSLTTFFALVPMLMETSTQARVIIPMAISLAFGIVFATVITLLLVPSLYVMLDDLRRLFRGEPVDTSSSELPAQS